MVYDFAAAVALLVLNVLTAVLDTVECADETGVLEGTGLMEIGLAARSSVSQDPPSYLPSNQLSTIAGSLKNAARLD